MSCVSFPSLTNENHRLSFIETQFRVVAHEMTLMESPRSCIWIKLFKESFISNSNNEKSFMVAFSLIYFVTLFDFSVFKMHLNVYFYSLYFIKYIHTLHKLISLSRWWHKLQETKSKWVRIYVLWYPRQSCWFLLSFCCNIEIL